MSDEFVIGRKLTTDEKRNTIEIGENNLQKEFRKKLSLKEQEYCRKHKPYCARCAKADFGKKIQDLAFDKNKRGLSLSLRDVEVLKEIDIDLDQYGNPKRFRLLDESEAWEPRIVGHTKTTELIGYFENYLCNECGHIDDRGAKVGGISVQVPPEFDERGNALSIEQRNARSKNKKI